MKKINRNEFIWMLILLALFIGLARLLLTGEILFFLHPKMIKFVILAEVILFAMIVFQKSRIYRETSTDENAKKIQMGHFIFMLPITIMMMRPTYLNSEAIANKGLNLGQFPIASNQFKNVDLKQNPFEQTAGDSGTTTIVSDVENEANNGLNVPQTASSSEQFENVNLNQKSSEQTAEELGITTTPESVVGSETSQDNFLPLLDEIYTYPASNGKEYTLEGYVLTDHIYGKDRFLVGQLVVSCCIADATTEGVLCELENCPRFESNQWVRVTGVIEPLNEMFPEEYNIPDFKMRVTKIEKIAPHESPYAYY